MHCYAHGVHSTEDSSAGVDLGRIFDDLVRLQIELWNTIDTRLRSECQLAMGWFQIMRLIERIDACRVNDIVDELRITIGGASKVVDRIEAADLCRRRANPDDGRSSIIELTPKGTTLLHQAEAVYAEELQRRLQAPLPPRTLTRFGDILHRLRIAGHTLED